MVPQESDLYATWKATGLPHKDAFWTKLWKTLCASEDGDDEDKYDDDDCNDDDYNDDDDDNDDDDGDDDDDE